MRLLYIIPISIVVAVIAAFILVVLVFIEIIDANTGDNHHKFKRIYSWFY